MELTGKNFLGPDNASGGPCTFRAVDPSTGATLEPDFHEAAPGEVDRAADLAAAAFSEVESDPETLSTLLEEAATAIESLGEELVARARAESGLPAARLTGERGRTCNQLRMFAGVVRAGTWVDARIDRADPDRKPLPKPDVRRMLVPLGPVAVFGASNFPLAFSVAGGDTASALAAGNPVVVKAHPAHPGTSEMVAGALRLAVQRAGLPPGWFSLLHGATPTTGERLVRHPAIRAVGFTGSFRGGRALFDVAASRPAPIPVFAEMGSVNPVLLFPRALKADPAKLAEGLHASVTMGVGQFCTNPGVVLGLEGDAFEAFAAKLAGLLAGTPPGVMLTAAIRDAYVREIERLKGVNGVTVAAEAPAAGDGAGASGCAALLRTRAANFLAEPALSGEVFGPSTLLVACRNAEEMKRVVKAMAGHLTATLRATEEDLREHASLVRAVLDRVGRVVVNGWPTGVEVCPSMHHGGPYPATTDSRATSVGTAAIQRFARPVCWQDAPDGLLPPELKNENPRRIWRLVDGEMTNDAVA